MECIIASNKISKYGLSIVKYEENSSLKETHNEKDGHLPTLDLHPTIRCPCAWGITVTDEAKPMVQ